MADDKTTTAPNSLITHQHEIPVTMVTENHNGDNISMDINSRYPLADMKQLGEINRNSTKTFKYFPDLLFNEMDINTENKENRLNFGEYKDDTLDNSHKCYKDCNNLNKSHTSNKENSNQKIYLSDFTDLNVDVNDQDEYKIHNKDFVDKSSDTSFFSRECGQNEQEKVFFDYESESKQFNTESGVKVFNQTHIVVSNDTQVSNHGKPNRKILSEIETNSKSDSSFVVEKKKTCVRNIVLEDTQQQIAAFVLDKKEQNSNERRTGNERNVQVLSDDQRDRAHHINVSPYKNGTTFVLDKKALNVKETQNEKGSDTLDDTRMLCEIYDNSITTVSASHEQNNNTRDSNHSIHDESFKDGCHYETREIGKSISIIQGHVDNGNWNNRKDIAADGTDNDNTHLDNDIFKQRDNSNCEDGSNEKARIELKNSIYFISDMSHVSEEQLSIHPLYCLKASASKNYSKLFQHIRSNTANQHITNTTCTSHQDFPGNFDFSDAVCSCNLSHSVMSTMLGERPQCIGKESSVLQHSDDKSLFCYNQEYLTPSNFHASKTRIGTGMEVLKKQNSHSEIVSTKKPDCDSYWGTGYNDESLNFISDEEDCLLDDDSGIATSVLSPSFQANNLDIDSSKKLVQFKHVHRKLVIEFSPIPIIRNRTIKQPKLKKIYTSNFQHSIDEGDFKFEFETFKSKHMHENGKNVENLYNYDNKTMPEKNIEGNKPLPIVKHAATIIGLNHQQQIQVDSKPVSNCENIQVIQGVKNGSTSEHTHGVVLPVSSRSEPVISRSNRIQSNAVPNCEHTQGVVNYSTSEDPHSKEFPVLSRKDEHDVPNLKNTINKKKKNIFIQKLLKVKNFFLTKKNEQH